LESCKLERAFLLKHTILIEPSFRLVAGVVCVLRFKIGCDRVREGCDLLGFEDEDGGRWERDVADWRLNFEDEYAGKEMWLAVVQ
jgi:hypothetical protein